MDQKSVFYVYVLFDQFGIPRYIGKGRGNRWKQHESEKIGKSNYRKFRFIRETMAAIGEIPKIKIRQHLTESDAFNIELAFIAAIGRFPDGPLVNRTDNRHGPSSEQTKMWHASRTPEQRAATARKTQETIARKYTQEQRSERARNNALSEGRHALSERMKAWQAKQSPEDRRLNASNAGKASALAVPYEVKRDQGLKNIATYMATTTKEQRQANANKTGLAKLTKDQLSINGKKGVATANANRTPEERSALARKARAAQLQTKNGGFDQHPRIDDTIGD